MTQQDFNAALSKALEIRKAKSEEEIEAIAAYLCGRGFRSDELFVYVSVADVQAKITEFEGSPLVIVDDPTQVYVGPRLPLFASRLWMRRQWRRMFAYKRPPNWQIERRYSDQPITSYFG